MFKYKSPLSRLLEGAGKAKDPAEETQAEAEAPKAEPIADFNALRAALAGGNLSSENYEEADELIPEDKMPEFNEGEGDAAASQDEPQDDAVMAEVMTEVQEADEPELQPAPEEDPVVTLHVAPDTQDDEPQPESELIESFEEVQVDTIEPEPEIDVVVVAEPETPAEEPEIAPQPAPAAPADDRRSRVKTTFLGFERPDTHVQEMIETAEPVAKTEAAQESFPVGWLVVTAGPGRGSSITLTEGLMQIGRNDDQAIQLDFGDTGISRSNHAVIAYDPEDRKCYLGHGGKANLVRLNGKPVLSTIALSSGDLIRISETSIRFVAFCDDGFDWRDA